MALALIFVGLGLGLFLAFGLAYVTAKDALQRAFIDIRKGSFGSARKHIIQAARLRPSLKQDQFLKELYEIVVSGRGATLTASDMSRFEEKIDKGPRSFVERAYSHPGFRFAAAGIVIAFLLIKLIELG